MPAARAALTRTPAQLSPRCRPRRFSRARLLAAPASAEEAASSASTALDSDTVFAALSAVQEAASGGQEASLSVASDVTAASSSAPADWLNSLLASTGEDELRLALASSLLLLYVLAKPGLLLGVLDLALLSPLDALLRQREFAELPKLSSRFASGNFGNLYLGSSAGQAIIAKKAKLVEGGAESLETEEHFARMLRRSPALSAGDVGAPFLGTYDNGDVLVWRDVGRTTLAQALASPGTALDALGDALRLPAAGSATDAARANSVARATMRALFVKLALLHSSGIVHRDVKPENLLIDSSGKLRLLDFGVAVDMRTGYGFDPAVPQCDPNYAPPELAVLPENTPTPPAPVAALLSPLLWFALQPELFDSYCAGIILLQLGVPALRRRNSVGPDSTFKRSLAEADYDLRRWRAGCSPTLYDFSVLDAGGGGAWDLACRLVTRRNALRRGRMSCSEALLHPWLLLGL